MRELPEPEGQLAWQTYTRDQVLAIQKQAYEDGRRDAWKESTDREFGIGFAEYLTASQKEAP